MNDSVKNSAVSSERLCMRPFSSADAPDVYEAISPTITRYMDFEPPASSEAFGVIWPAWISAMETEADFHFVARVKKSGEFIGLAGLHPYRDEVPELGLWVKESAQGQGFGGEAVRAVISWAASRNGTTSFVWPVAEGNLASRRLAESLGGVVDDYAVRPKFKALVYRIPA